MSPLALDLLLNLTEVDAARRVWDLPSVRAWAERVRKHPGVRPFSMLEGEAEGRWTFCFGESRSDLTVRWNTFEVDGVTGAIRNWDFALDGWVPVR